MKKIGIITMHRVCNYGSVLQTYALFHAIKRMGCDAEVIDYIFPNTESHPQGTCIQRGNAYLKQFIKTLFFPNRRRRKHKIWNFVQQHTTLSKCCYLTSSSLLKNPPHYDVYVTGSDQVWSCQHVQHDTTFLLPFAPENALRISYGASFGAGQVKESLRVQYASLLSKYQHISVREPSGQVQVAQLCHRPAEIVVDPTLLLTADEWNRLAGTTRPKGAPTKYILLYLLKYSFDPFPTINALIHRLADCYEGEIIILGERPPYPEYRTITAISDVGVQDFLQWIKHADIVVTTSFHGTLFAVQFHRHFFSIIGGAHVADSRIFELLQQLELTKLALTPDRAVQSIPTHLTSSINYAVVDKKIAKWRLKSLDYLKNALNTVKY